MRMLLRPEYLNGPFGDPALYIWETNEKDALLLDCGDLSRLSTRQLFRTKYIFLSHCHIDHVFGFDHFLRIHMGSEKTVFIFGPPETSQRIRGKLQGYTWNLVSDHKLEFIVTELDPFNHKKLRTSFRAYEAFKARDEGSESWQVTDSVLDAGIYKIYARPLDHRTLSMAYSVEEKLTMGLNTEAVEQLGLKLGEWISDLKRRFVYGFPEDDTIQVTADHGVKTLKTGELGHKVLIPRQRHKISYATDGGVSEQNWKNLVELVAGADTFYCETCFTTGDKNHATETMHFTTEFIGSLAEFAKVKRLVPIHFSKRYLGHPERVWQELAQYYSGEIVQIHPAPPQIHL